MCASRAWSRTNRPSWTHAKRASNARSRRWRTSSGSSNEEIESLRSKTEAMERQVELARKERSGVGKLSRQGLAVTSRLLAAERTVAELEARMLDMDMARLRAQQEIAKARQTIVSLRASHAARIAQERLDTQAELGRVESRSWSCSAACATRPSPSRAPAPRPRRKRFPRASPSCASWAGAKPASRPSPRRRSCRATCSTWASS